MNVIGMKAEMNRAGGQQMLSTQPWLLYDTASPDSAYHLASNRLIHVIVVTR